MATQESNADVFRRYLKDVWEGGRLDTLDDFFAPDFLNHNPVPGLPANRDGERRLVEMFREAFSSFTTNVETAVPEGERLAARWTAKGTHTGTFAGVPPTGIEITMIGIEFLRFVDGKIAEVWINFDMAGLLQQLGVIPSPS